MKRTTLFICLVLLPLLACAQPRQFPPERMSDEEIIQMQIRDIVFWLRLDKGMETRFIKEYTAFRKEIDEISEKAKPSHNIDSETEIDKAIQQNFAVSEQILQIRKKYYARFKEFMKPSQIRMMYHIENEAGRRMHGGPEGPGEHSGPEDQGEHHGPEDRPAPPHHRGDDPAIRL